MHGKDLIEKLQKEFGNVSQETLAAMLGKKSSQVSAMKKMENISPLTVARMMASLNKQIVRGKDLLPAVQRKLDIDSRANLAKTLNITLGNWERQKKGLTANQVANAIKASRAAAKADSHRKLIRPIVEFFPLDAVPSAQGAHYELFETKSKNGAQRQQKELRELLKQKKGIYIFYDSRGKAIYAGKAHERTLWAELKNVFNRDRESQSVYRVKHPRRNQKFQAAFEVEKQPVKTPVLLSEISAYVSAYEVDGPVIGSLEALLVRGFANDLLNVRMEKFSAGRKKKKKASLAPKKKVAAKRKAAL